MAGSGRVRRLGTHALPVTTGGNIAVPAQTVGILKAGLSLGVAHTARLAMEGQKAAVQ